MSVLELAHETISAQVLRQYVEKIERLEEDKANISSDIKDVYVDAKNNGFDTKALKQIIKLRTLDKEEIENQEAILDLYKSALGM